MSLQPYDDLAKTHGLSQLSGVPIEHPLLENIGSFIQASRNGALRGIWILSTIVWTFVLFFFFVIPSSDNDPAFFIIIPLFCLGPIVIAFLLVSIYAFVMSTLLAPPDLLISNIMLKRNEELEMHYQQTFKRAVVLRSLSFSLILKESATYDQGTSTVTEHHENVIDERAEFDVSVGPDAGIDRHLTFKVPNDAMHSFEAYRNKLQWFLKVSTDIPNFPDFEKTYLLKVIAEVADES